MMEKLPDIKINFDTIVESNKVIISLPIRTVSEANCFQAWRTKHKRHQDQKKAVWHALFNVRERVTLPCTVVMTRYAKKFLDEEDNLRISLKWIKDSIAEILVNDFVPGRADGDKRITWQYAQEKNKNYGVKIEIISKQN